jgi:DNA-binding NarL/FixJ family response regulator
VIRVLVWAKSRIARAGLEAIVQADARFELAGAGNRPADLAVAVRQFAPDVVLVDGEETETARRIAAAAPGRGMAGQEMAGRELAGRGSTGLAPAVVGLVDGQRRADIVRALQAGVRALILRESHPNEITAALQAASDGLAVISPEILDVLLPAVGETADEDSFALEEPLTGRETEVLGLLAEGAGNKEIAARLGISEHTAKFHVSSILSKLGASSRTEAVTRGYREGLILI